MIALPRRRAAMFCGALLACWVCASRADPGDPRGTSATTAMPLAPVVVDGRALMKLRGVSALPAGQRSAEVAARVERAAHDPAVESNALRLVEGDDRTTIMAGELPLLAVLDADARTEGLADRTVLAEVYRDKLAAAIDRYRHERTAAFLGGQAAKAALAIAVALVLLLALRLALTRLVARARRALANRLDTVEARAFDLFATPGFERTVTGLIDALRWLLAFVVVFVALEYVLSLFPWTRYAAIWITGLLVDPLRTLGNGLVHALPGLVFIAVLAALTRYGLRLLQVFFGGLASGGIRIGGFVREWAWPTYRLVRIAVVALALVIAYPYIPGSSSDAFKGISIFFGLLMSLGAASAVANSLAGYTLIYRRTFQVGDRIRVGEVAGDVVEMRQQVTHLRSVKNEVITIPSSTMLTSQVINYSSLERSAGLILHADVGAGYDTPWRQVEAMLLLAASRTESVQQEPSPFVLVKALGDFAIVYELNVYCARAQAMERAYSMLYRNVIDVFNEFDVSLLSPAYQADPDVPKVVARDQWYRPPARPPVPG